ncbi:DUF421 domain-containing protein [Halalkalibacter krulwichiae]|uniref:YetF C-terminal domain-containing protein n=1 Tax=Halalkalibacter krulwichiae TaxID=199441 RepID=A0A1X9MA07_9BACI|nr:DUF421 domain-containing protein [Halalkalibacter krulwichiae]ARK30237.1 hypothetical protein BkAM31D_10570 [Halalkalibacter krulwichiae]
MLLELTNVLARIVTIYPLLLAMTLFMGKRSIGQLPIFDFLIFVTLANVTGADLADPSVEHVHTAFAIVAIAFLQKSVAKLAFKKRKFGKLITFEPIVVIKDGQLLVDNLQSIQFTVDNILQMLRQKNVFDIYEVQLGVIEANGELSVQKKPAKAAPSIEDLGITKKSSGISYPVIIEGEMKEEILKELKISKESLRKRLEDEGIIRLEKIFLCTINGEGDLQLAFTKKDEHYQRIQH